MNIQAIRHSGTYPDQYAAARDRLVFRLFASRDDALACTLCYFQRNHREETLKKAVMTKKYTDASFTCYEAVVRFETFVRNLEYYFEIASSEETVYYTAWGVQKTLPENGIFEFAYANEMKVPQLSPAWTRGTVYYQIFPERFGKAGKERPGLVPWGSIPTPDNFMGGNLAGVSEKLDYLSKLGIGCIYFNPIFKAPSNHKYDTEDYFLIDPDFGTNEEFGALVKKAHEKGIRVILDAVFNHIGVNFFAFRDLLRNQEQSPYKDWFFVHRYPVAVEDQECYESFFGFMGMPKLNTANPETAEYLLSVLRFWAEEYGVDGFRFDVADEIDETFLQKLRDRMKRLNPDLVLIAETWAEGKRLLNGSQMDSIMNYSFRTAMLDFFADRTIDAKTLSDRLEGTLSRFPDETNASLFNLLDSHDTARFLTSCGKRCSSFKLAVVFQLLYIGAPSVYYGDELLMEGETDPDCRRAMPETISKEAQETYDFYRELLAFRREHEAVTKGSYRTVYADGRVFGFVRSSENEKVYVYLNDGQEARRIPGPDGREFELPAGSYRYFAVTN